MGEGCCYHISGSHQRPDYNVTFGPRQEGRKCCDFLKEEHPRQREQWAQRPCWTVCLVGSRCSKDTHIAGVVSAKGRMIGGELEKENSLVE